MASLRISFLDKFIWELALADINRGVEKEDKEETAREGCVI